MSPALRRALYAGVIFWSALLLLLVQPVLTRAILPWFGGSAGVWTTSMLFYQTVLLLGYLYAHVVTRRLPVRAHVAVHATLLIAACLLLPLRPSLAWKPTDGSEPVSRILLLLLTSAGLPYFLLSTRALCCRPGCAFLPNPSPVAFVRSVERRIARGAAGLSGADRARVHGSLAARMVVCRFHCVCGFFVAAALLSGRGAETPVEADILPRHRVYWSGLRWRRCLPCCGWRSRVA